MTKTATPQASSSDRFALETYGVRVGFRCARPDILDEVKRGLYAVIPHGKYREIPYKRADERFIIGQTRDHEYVFYHGRKRVTAGDNRQHFLRYFESIVRITIAEKADPFVFVHAGVVAWKGLAIVIPASSFAGKSTLVAELVKRGAEYYSDEYAVLDSEGLVHPYLKPLSMRHPGERAQRDVAVSELGGTVGREPVPVGLVLITSYDAAAVSNPVAISPAMGILEILPHSISASYKPEFTLNVLNKMTNRAIILKLMRGEAEDFAPELLKLFENIALRHVIIA